AVAIERLARRVPDGVAGKHDSPRTGAQAWGVSALCGVAGSTVGVWLIAQTGLKGQAVGASLVGSMLGAIGAYALDHRASMWAVLAGSVVVSVAGPVLAMATGGDDAHLHAAVIAGSVSRLALPIGLDAVAGACMGVPVGLYVGNGLMGHASHVAGHVE
ncbi:MAG: hypothetical protein K2Q09_06885, partial [Phycisphaerales bacterium]|nr:hypothetical protein [Phycisphaerales bacterium]